MNLAMVIEHEEEVQLYLKKAHETFFAQSEPAPVWTAFTLGDLLLDDAYAYRELGLWQAALEACEQIEQQYQRDGARLTSCIEAQLLAVLIEASRNDQPRHLDWCLDKWQAGVAGAQQLQSEQRLAEAQLAYIALCTTFTGKLRLSQLRELLTR